MADFKVYFNSGKTFTVRNCGYWTNRTHVMFWRKGANRKKEKPKYKYRLSTVKTWEEVK